MGATAATGRFGAVVTAMVTPFDEEGLLDVESAASVARWLAAHGSDGLVVAGTTGEGIVLSDTEFGDLVRAVSEAVTVPVLAGTGTSDTRHSVELTRLAAEAGADGVLVVTPYYSRPSQAGLFEHFATVAASTALPIVLYDIPVRTGREITRETVFRLAHTFPNVVAVKDAAGDLAASARLVAEAPAGFELYSGDDVLTLPLLSVGAVGVISVASHWAGPEIGEMIAAFSKGDVEGARLANARLLASYDFVSVGDEYPNPMPAKAACRVLGLPVGQCRSPIGAAPSDLDGLARSLIAELGRSEPFGIDSRSAG